MEQKTKTGTKLKFYHLLMVKTFGNNRFQFEKGNDCIVAHANKPSDKIFLSHLYRTRLLEKPVRGVYLNVFSEKDCDNIDYDKKAASLSLMAKKKHKKVPLSLDFKPSLPKDEITKTIEMTEQSCIDFLKTFGQKYKIMVRQQEYKEI